MKLPHSQPSRRETFRGKSRPRHHKYLTPPPQWSATDQQRARDRSRSTSRIDLSAPPWKAESRCAIRARGLRLQSQILPPACRASPCCLLGSPPESLLSSVSRS